MSSDICWAVVRKNSSFLVKSHNQGLTLTREPGNLTGLNTYKHNGYVNKKSIGIEAGADGKGVTLTLNSKNGKKVSTKITGGARRTNGVIKVSVVIINCCLANLKISPTNQTTNQFNT